MSDRVVQHPAAVVGSDVSPGQLSDRMVVDRGATVENDTTIASRTRIQTGAYITAYVTGSVVTRDVPPHTVVMGVPAKRVRDVPAEELLGAE